MAQKIIRDPVHDVITLQTDHPVEGLLFRLIACPEFQRLRRIRQLGMASLAYPGADHSRYSHSLGVMETCRQILDHLSRQTKKISERDRAATLAAALLHDLGHGPFSHVFERVSGVHHEKLTYRVILDPDSEINHRLSEYDLDLPHRVVDLLQGKPNKTFLSDCLSSQLDADRLDYLLRDNLMTGSQYGNYDLRWLLQSMTVADNGRLAVTWKGISAVEAYLQARYHMYRNVYFHKVVRAGEGMVKLALQRARRMAVQGRLDWPTQDEAVYKMLLGQRLSIAEFTGMDDVSVLHCFKQWTKSDDHTLAVLCEGLLDRRLFKTIDLSRESDERVTEITQAASGYVDSEGGEAAYAMFYDAPADTPYKSSGDAEAASEILVCEPDGKVQTIAQTSPFIEGLMKQLTFKRLHVSEQWRNRVEKVIADL